MERLGLTEIQMELIRMVESYNYQKGKAEAYREILEADGKVKPKRISAGLY